MYTKKNLWVYIQKIILKILMIRITTRRESRYGVNISDTIRKCNCPLVGPFHQIYINIWLIFVDLWWLAFALFLMCIIEVDIQTLSQAPAS